MLSQRLLILQCCETHAPLRLAVWVILNLLPRIRSEMTTAVTAEERAGGVRSRTRPHTIVFPSGSTSLLLVGIRRRGGKTGKARHEQTAN